MTVQTLGDRIRKARKAKHLSLNDLAERMGLDKAYLSRVENGHTEPRLANLRRFAEVLGISTSRLVG